MVFKEESIIERLKKLQETIDELENMREISKEEFIRKRNAQWIIERGLEVASSEILDIGNHILSSVYSSSPRDYDEIIEQLNLKDIISDELYDNLKGLGGFRKILIHGYFRN